MRRARADQAGEGRHDGRLSGVLRLVGWREATACRGDLTIWKSAAPGSARGDGRMPAMIGSVTRDRYDELVKLGRDWVATMSVVQWRLGGRGRGDRADALVRECESVRER